MSFNFPLILLSVIVFTGAVALCDFIFCMARGEKVLEKKKRPLVIEYSRAFFPILLAVFLIRSFVAQPYRVPSGSLEPTVIPGDFIFVNQFHYGLRFPVWDKEIISVGHPMHGEIALFFYPVNHAVTFVKRVIGEPGDHITYINKTLYINGAKQPQQYIKTVTRLNDFGQLTTYQEYQEKFMGVVHNIFVRADVPSTNFYNIVVPKGDYFMMGDNRDDSDDSRYWGFVPAHDFIGHAVLVWMNWDSHAAHWYEYIRWDRIGKRI